MVGAVIAWVVRVPTRVVASVMAFGAGVLISALAFDLVDEAEHTGGLFAVALGFLGGAAVYVAANAVLAHYGAKHRKRSHGHQPTEEQQDGSGAAIAIGALLDGVPESVVLGVSLLGGHGVGVPVLAAVFISNLPEGLSSAAGMKEANRSARYVFAVWIGIAVLSGLAAMLGYLLLDDASPFLIAVHHGDRRWRDPGDDRRHDGARGVFGDPHPDRADHHDRFLDGVRGRATRLSRMPRRDHHRPVMLACVASRRTVGQRRESSIFKARIATVCGAAATAAVIAACGSGGTEENSSQPPASPQSSAESANGTQDGDLVFTLDRVERDWVDPNHTRAPQGTWVLIPVTAKNVGDGAQTFRAEDQKLKEPGWTGH